jgi:type IV pilus assembly protein PilM
VVELRVSERGATIRRALYLDAAALKERKVDPQDRPQVAALLKKLMVEAGIPTRDVVLGISGKESIIRYTHVPPVPAWRLKIIMDYEVGEVAEKIGEKLTSDFRVLPVTRTADDDQLVVIALAKESVLEGSLSDLAAAGISVAKAMPSAVALYAAASAFGKKPDPDNPEDELEVVIDLGAENLNLVFLLNGNLAFVRSASFGGKNFTEALSRDLGMPFEKAEALKLREGTVEQGGRREEVSNTLRGAAVQLLSMVQTSVKFARGQTGADLPEPTRYVLLGGGAALHGLVSYLQAGLKKPVEVFHPSAVASPDVEGDAARALAAAPGNFAVALGLAASSVRRGGLELSLLPAKYVERRAFRERTLFMYLAAGFLLAFLILKLAQGISENSAVAKRRTDLESWKKFYDRAKTEMLESGAQNVKARARINRVLREAELTPFEAFALDVLARRSGSELKILDLKLVIDPGDGTDPEYQLQIDGAADNASQKALERIKELRSAFTGEPRVARVEVPSTTPEGNWYRFQMVLTPGYPVQR